LLDSLLQESFIMSSISATLSRQSYEMAIHLIGTEILNASNRNQDVLSMMSMLSSDSSSEDEDERMYLVLLQQAQSASDDERLISLVYEAYKEILRLPSAILRPYQSHLRTDSGANRTRNFEDLRLRFGVDASRILRFSVPQIEEIVDVLQIPADFSFCGHNCTGIEALTISLHRMSTHMRFVDLSLVYDLLPSFLSQIFAGFSLWLYTNFGDAVRSFENPWTTERSWLELFSDKLELNGCPLPNTFGFIDGTHIEEESRINLMKKQHGTGR